MTAAVDEAAQAVQQPATPDRWCQFLVHNRMTTPITTTVCGNPGYWLVVTTCPACGARAVDVLCRDHGGDVFAANDAFYTCPDCHVESLAPPAVWSRL